MNSVHEFSTENLVHTPRAREADDIWTTAGWETSEEFEAWWLKLVERHPNPKANGQAKSMLIELVMAGTIKRADFEQGYMALVEVNTERWAEQHGRYAENLLVILQDRLWAFALAKVNGNGSRRELQAQAEAEAFEQKYLAWLSTHPGASRNDFADWQIAESEREFQQDLREIRGKA